MRSLAVFVVRHLVFTFIFLLVVNSLWAQSDRGAISGSILDSSGGVVVGADITVTGVDTGSVYKAVSTSTGAYHISDLVVGNYDLTVAAKGFKLSENKGLVVQINTTASLDITLQPGDMKETLTVFADAPTIQTESADIGTVVGQKQIQQLPLSIAASGQSFLRSPEAFVFITPGTAGPGTNSDHGAAGTFETKLAGGQNFGTEVLLDGVSTSRMDTSSAFDQTAPSIEALNEFKVTTSTIPAGFGRTSGGVESFTTRSGTNSFHGAAFEFYKNDKFDANSWYNNWQDLPKPRDHKNNYGGTFGGPVWIPKVYNGKDKSFFFFSWEQFQQSIGVPVTSTLPTMAERSGDFSAVLGTPIKDAQGNTVLNPCDGTPVLQGQIFDPASTKIVNGTPCRTAFVNNQVPLTSTVAQNVLGYLPSISPSAPLVNNFVYTGTNSNLDTAMTVRIDQNIGANNKAFFSYSKRSYEAPNGPSNLPGPLDQNYFNTNTTYYARFGLDTVFTPAVVNHFNIGLNRINHFSKGTSVTGPDWDQVLGIGNASGQVFPQFSFGGSPSGIGYVGYSTAQNNGDLPNSLVLADSITWVKGRHSLHLGLEWRSYQFSIPSEAYTSPSYNFMNYQTSYTPGDTHTGDPFASFLLGAPQGETLTVYSIFPRWAANYYAAYVQDDYKIRKDLTLNLGLRYDVDTPRHEAHLAQSNLSLTTPNPGTPGQLGAMVYGLYAPLGNTYWKDFAPRVGFAYAPESLFGHVTNLVVRGGYSIYYSPLVYSDFGGSFSNGTTASPSFNSGDNFSVQQSPDAGFPQYPAPSNANDPTLLNGQGPNYVAPEYGRPGTVQNWSLEIQKQLTQDLILSVGYVGMHSTHLRSSLAQLNNLTPGYYNLKGNAPSCGAGVTYGPSVINDPYNSCTGTSALADLGVTVPSWLPDLYGGNPSVGQVLRPYSQFQSISTDGGLENLGQSTYNAAMVKLERRFRNGLNLMASYTFSKTLTDADSTYPLFTSFNSGVWAQDSFNLKNNKAVSYQDIPQIFVLSYVYELPVGPGKKFIDKKGVVGKIVGGWQVSGVQRYQSGSPVSFNCNATGIPFNSGNICLDRVSGQSWLAGTSGSFNGPDAYLLLQKAQAADPSTNWGYGCNSGQVVPTGAAPYFNCAGFADTNSAANVAQRGYSFGNIPRTVGNIRSASYFNEDFSVIKNTYITENQFIQFRVDFLNAFNRHTFAPPDSTWNDTTFGIPAYGGSSLVINAPKTVQFSLRYQF
jgi:Carboxypeptidase regulatory-like domain